MLLIDDAERISESADKVFEKLSKGEEIKGVRMIASARPIELRSNYSHWTREMRKARLGVLLQPAPDSDSDMFGMIPRRAPVQLSVGRGYAYLADSPRLLQLLS